MTDRVNPGRLAGVRSTLGEPALVAALGFALALAGNALSPRGLVVNRDYFPADRSAAGSGASPTGTPTGATNLVATAPLVGPPAAVPDSVEARVQARGFSVVTREEARALLDDPRHAQELVLFVDARDDRHYQEGHLPGAYPLDRFHPERYLADLLGPCTAAERVVVYCTGGDCEDSLFAAALLHDAGVASGRLGVYVGGIADWQSAGLPVEVGGRLSGDLRAPAGEDTPTPAPEAGR